VVATPIKLRFSSVDDFLRAHLRDPALDGLFVPASVAVPVGTRLDLTVEFAPGKCLKTAAEVVSSTASVGGESGELALRFIALHPEYRAWLDKRLAELRSRTAAPAAAATTDEASHLLRKAESALKLAGSVDLLTGVSDAEGEPVLGIDLGTCNSAACLVVGGKPQIIDVRDENDHRPGVRSIPSVVAFAENGSETVGLAALEGIASNPRQTIFGAKRFIGRTYDSPVVQSMLTRFPYKVVPGPGGRVAVEINGRSVALTAISAKILSTIRRRGERQLGRTLQRAVITVPAYYNENQRDAVVQAGRLAGLTVERILNEPTAAAIAYGLSRSQPRRLLVYDLGGGTFDVSVMSVQRDALQVLSTAGDTFLGGEDFDAAIVKWLVAEFAKKSGKPLSQNHAGLAVIKQAAEQAKRRLSTNEKTMVVVREVMLADRSTTRLELELSRPTLESLVEPLVTRTLKICDMALHEARLEASQLGDVILVGGQTLMPCVRQRVREHFKIAPRCDLNPDEVVALGAGLLASFGKSESAKFRDVLSMSIGVAVAGRFKPLVARNTPVPCNKSFTIQVPKEKLATYALEVWQGDSATLRENEHLGTLNVDAVGPGPDDPVPLRVDFVLSPDCRLKVRVTNVRTEESQEVLLSTRDTTGVPVHH
jgi:molecular chaperone DnaK